MQPLLGRVFAWSLLMGGLLGAILAVAFPAFIWMLTRMKIHEAIKFGDETG